jgi:nucleotide-binding universal stress UspA family protein
MFTHAFTVVGVDGSSAALDAVRWAAHDARLHRSDLLLVSSASPPSPVLLSSSYHRALHSNAERALAEAKALAIRTVDQARDVRVVTKVVSQQPIPALLQMSKDARLVVAGNRGGSRVHQRSLGSVSEALASHAHSPLTVVRGRTARDLAASRTIVVGTDGSAAARSAVEVAFAQAAARDVSLTVVHAWADGDLGLVPGSSGGEPVNWPTVREEAEDMTYRGIHELRQRYPRTPIRSVVVRDRPAHALLDHAQAAQLVVVGRQGRGGFAGMLLGSTSRTVLHGAQCPVMLVPA